MTANSSNEFYPSWHGSHEIAFVSDRREKPGVYAISPVAASNPTERLVAAAEGAVSAPAFAPDGSSIAFNVIGGAKSRLMVVDGASGERNIADPDEDVFPFRPQWISQNQLLYTADGRIKRRLCNIRATSPSCSHGAQGTSGNGIQEIRCAGLQSHR